MAINIHNAEFIISAVKSSQFPDDNLPEIVEYYGSNSRKISCDWYIDDKNMMVEKLEA